MSRFGHFPEIPEHETWALSPDYYLKTYCISQFLHFSRQYQQADILLDYVQRTPPPKWVKSLQATETNGPNDTCNRVKVKQKP